jgi:hypothetical protein
MHCFAPHPLFIGKIKIHGLHSFEIETTLETLTLKIPIIYQLY